MKFNFREPFPPVRSPERARPSRLHLSGESATECPAALTHKIPGKTGTVRLITDLSGKQVYAALRRYVLK